MPAASCLPVDSLRTGAQARRVVEFDELAREIRKKAKSGDCIRFLLDWDALDDIFNALHRLKVESNATPKSIMAFRYTLIPDYFTV